MDGDSNGKILEAVLLVLEDQRKLSTRLIEGQQANTLAIHKLIEGQQANTLAIHKLSEGQEANTRAIYKLIEGQEANTRAINEMRQDISEMRQDISEMRQDISEMRQDISEMRRDIRTLQDVTKEHTRAITILNHTMERFDKEIEKVIDIYGSDIADLRQRVVKLENKAV